MKDYDILQKFCKVAKRAGLGNAWHEGGLTENDHTVKYKAYQLTMLTSITILIVTQNLALIFGEYSEEETQICRSYSFTHLAMFVKVVSIIWNRTLIKKLNRRIVPICEGIEDPVMMEEKYKTIKHNVYFFITTCSIAVVFGHFERIRKTIQGAHFVMVVTIYPQTENDSLPANITRIVMGLSFVWLMIPMMAADLFTMAYLIIYKYKFITLKRYFYKLGEEFQGLVESGHKMTSADYDGFCNGLLKGYAMHADLLQLFEEIQEAFGTVITCQLVLSTASAGNLLLQTAFEAEFHSVTIVRIVFLLTYFYMLLALFLHNAGDITYQAALLSDAIFYCGWYMSVPCHRGKSIRKLIQIGVAQAQKPLMMKSFKMVELTYATFLSVVKATYSLFTLFYTQK